MRRTLTNAMLMGLGVAAVAGGTLAQGVSAGRAVAERYCSACHHVADGKSPNPAAPPFAKLQDRYGGGGLAELLEKGMIKNRPYPLEEGMRLVHPSMPAFPVTEVEAVSLARYLRTFEAMPPGGKEP